MIHNSTGQKEICLGVMFLSSVAISGFSSSAASASPSSARRGALILMEMVKI